MMTPSMVTPAPIIKLLTMGLKNRTLDKGPVKTRSR